MSEPVIKLTKKDILTLEDIHACLTNKSDADKVKAIILLGKGWSYSQIEEALLLDERTIHRYRNKFLIGGVDELLDNKYKGGFSKLTCEEKNLLAEELKKIFILIRFQYAIILRKHLVKRTHLRDLFLYCIL